MKEIPDTQAFLILRVLGGLSASDLLDLDLL